MNEYLEALRQLGTGDAEAHGIRTWLAACAPACGVLYRGRVASEFRGKSEIRLFGLPGVLILQNRVGETMHVEVAGGFEFDGTLRSIEGRWLTFDIVRGASRSCVAPGCGHPEPDHFDEPRYELGRLREFEAVCRRCPPTASVEGHYAHDFATVATRCHAPGCVGSYSPAGICQACEAPRGAS